MNKEDLSVIIVDYNSIIKTLNYIAELHYYIKSDFNVHYVVVENYERPLKFSELNAWRRGWTVKKERTKNNEKIYTSSYLGATIDILWNGMNSGFAIGNNAGTIYSKEYFHPSLILYSNNDIIFQSKFNINSMAQILREDYSVAAVGPYVTGLDGERQGPARKVGYIWGLLLHEFVPDKYKRESALIKEPKKGYVYWVSGCFMLVNADKIYQAGLFDEHTFLYCEEMILAERFLVHGWRFYYDDEALIIHEGGRTISKYSDSIEQLQMKFTSRLYYYKRYIGINFLQYILAIFVFRCGLTLHICKRKIGKKICLEIKRR